jgi:hypothetical protein
MICNYLFYVTEVDDFRLKTSQLEKQISELQLKNEDLQSTAEQARRWKDEVDELRHEAVKVEKLELTLDLYKKKIGMIVTLLGSQRHA